MTKPIFENTQRVTFDCAHFLEDRHGRPEYERMHGHSYVCEITIRGHRSNQHGWLMDFAMFQHAMNVVAEQLDHRTLNDIEGLENPTMENITMWIGNRFQRWLKHCGSESLALEVSRVKLLRPTIGQSCTYFPTEPEPERIQNQNLLTGE